MLQFFFKHQLNIMLALQSICAIIILLTLMTKNLSRQRKFAIILLEVSAIIFLGASRTYNLYKDQTSTMALYMVRFAKFFDYFMSHFVIFAFSIYLRDLYKNEGGLKKTPVLIYISDLFLGLGILMIIVSQFTGFYYYFDEAGNYSRGPGRLLNYILPFLALFCILICVIRNYKRLSNNLRIPIILFMVLPLAATIIQFFIKGSSLSNISTVGMAIVLYIFAIQELNRTIEAAHKREVQMLENYKKELEETVEIRTHELKIANEKANTLLLNILPAPVARELTENPGKTISQKYPNATVLFTDIVGFTKMSSSMTAEETVTMLNKMVSLFDERAEREGIEKIKTIGDAYMAVTGLTDQAQNDGVIKMIKFARGLLQDVQAYNQANNQNIQIRVGINSGNLVAGVIGKNKFIYDVWGDTVNVASRMESSGQPMQIHVSESVYQQTKDKENFSQSVQIDVKGKGLMNTYFVGK